MKKLLVFALLCTPNVHAATCQDIQDFFTQAFADTNSIDQKLGTITTLFDQLFTDLDNVNVQSGLVNPCQPIALMGDGPHILDQPGATYLLQNNATGGITIDASNVTLDLCGKEVSTLGITVNDGHNNIIIRNGKIDSVLVTNDVNTNANITIQDISVDGGRIDFNNITKIRIIDCTVCNSSAIGIDLLGCNGILIERALVDNSTSHNIALFTCSNALINRCISTNATANGIDIAGASSNILLHKNTCDTNSSGISFNNSSRCIVDTCQAHGNSTGISTNNNVQCLFFNNVDAHTNTGNGFLFDNTSNCKLLQCTAHANTGALDAGFTFTAAARFAVNDCCAFGNTNHGFNIGGDTDNLCFVDNVAKNNGDIGFNVDGIDHILQRNIAVNNASGFTDGGTGHLYTQNVAHANVTDDFVGVSPVTAFSSGTPGYWENVEA